MTLEAFQPLGKDYVAALNKGYNERWVDFLPTTGKSPGAYSNSAYGIHPYQLLNFNGAYEDVSTLAHESGHSMHTYLSMEHQPYATANYSTFVAEVASTLNEGLLFHYMLDKTRDDKTRLFLLSSYLDEMRGTLFRQTLFAEFELRIHEAVERGEPLTGESLSKLYLELVRKYYGQEQGIVNIDDKYGAEWAFVPHFYLNFYVYQYATSMIAGMSLLDGIVGDAAKKSGTATGNRDRYLTLQPAERSRLPVGRSRLLRRVADDAVGELTCRRSCWCVLVHVEVAVEVRDERPLGAVVLVDLHHAGVVTVVLAQQLEIQRVERIARQRLAALDRLVDPELELGEQRLPEQCRAHCRDSSTAGTAACRRLRVRSST